VPSSGVAVELAERYPHVYAAVGIHPSDCDDFTEADIETLRQMAQHEKVVAIGEIGLDYYWKDNAPKEFQELVFRRQIELALELDLPVIVHDREAHGDTMRILWDYPQARGVIHCFSGSWEIAKEYLKLGFYISFAGPVTFKKAPKLQEAALNVPLDRLLVETDSPYLAPEPVRGRRNEPTHVRHVAQKIADLRQMPLEDLARITTENAMRMYGI